MNEGVKNYYVWNLEEEKKKECDFLEMIVSIMHRQLVLLTNLLTIYGFIFYLNYLILWKICKYNAICWKIEFFSSMRSLVKIKVRKRLKTTCGLLWFSIYGCILIKNDVTSCFMHFLHTEQEQLMCYSGCVEVSFLFRVSLLNIDF